MLIKYGSSRLLKVTNGALKPELSSDEAKGPRKTEGRRNPAAPEPRINENGAPMPYLL